MRLAAITIRHFKAIQELTLTLPSTDPERPGSADFLTLLGENNRAKSSVLEALRLALPGVEPRQATLDHFHQRRPDLGPIEVELTFDRLTAADRARRGIRLHICDNRYRIRKTWSEPGTRPAVAVYAPAYEVPGLAEAALLGRGELVRHGTRWAQIVELYEEHQSARLREGRLAQATVDGLRRFVVEHAFDLVEVGAPGWSANPGGFTANPDSAMPIVIFVPAVREVSAEADPGAARSAAQALIRALFERSLAQHEAVRAYRAAGAAVEALFARSTAEPAVNAVRQALTARVQRLIDVEIHIDFNAPDLIESLSRLATLSIVDGDVVTSPQHQGHGAQRALILTLLELYAEQLREPARSADGAARAPGADPAERDVLVLVEEPETYLHPQMCRRMRDVLVRIAQSGTGQVICTSHSPIFIDLADRHDGIAILRRDPGGVIRAVQRGDDLFGGPSAGEQRQRLRMLLDFDPSVNEAFFARRVCLVEGDCELAALAALRRRLVADGVVDRECLANALRNLAVVNCRGKWTIPAFQRVLAAFEIPYVVVHDADQEGAGGANAAILAELGGDETRRRLHRPNFEGQIWGESWTADKPWRATQRILREPPGPDLLAFFEFVLGRPLAALAPPAPEPAAPAGPA